MPALDRRSHWLAATILALFVLLLYYPLLFTNRVLASGDLLLYFYPYRDYAAAALRNGQLPLWNPYIFLGVPFFANPQAAVLYPLHWPLIWLPVTQQIYASAGIHTWLLGLGGYCLARRWGISGTGSLVTALLLAGSGFYGGLIGHLNQMNVVAWLPWALWLLEGVHGRSASGGTLDKSVGDPGYTLSISLAARMGLGRGWLRQSVCFGWLVALMLLAGHTQSAFINLVGVGLWLLWPQGRINRQGWHLSALWSFYGPRLTVYTAGCLWGVLLSAVQLLPTWELSGLGLRNGGLSYGEATSFSLKPLHLPWTLLPTYGLVDLEQIFATPGYTEYIAYLSLSGLLLALLGGWQGRGRAHTLGLLFAALGLFLALGRWNPFYYLLYRLVPGFDLFRNPARWMMLYTLGLTVLAGVGVDCWLRLRGGWEMMGKWSIKIGLAPPQSLITTVQFLLISLLVTDLLLAARALPHTQPTAPQAVYDVRSAPAYLLTDPVRQQIDPAAAGRFLGMSTITYDPGDMADWRRILQEQAPAQLDERAFAQFIIALKIQELLVPNLPLLWRVPAVDGFDGGVLPLQRYNRLLTLFVPPDQLVPDGRLREQLKAVPPSALLNLLNVQYLITDKVRDLWFADVFYDRQIGARLTPNSPSLLRIEAPLPFPTTQLDLIGYVAGPLAGLADQTVPVAAVTVTGADAQSAHFTLTAGGQPGALLADPQLDSPLAVRNGATVAYRDVAGQRQEYRVRLTLPAPFSPQTVTVQRLATPYDLVVQAVTLVDQRTGMFTPLLPSDRGRFRLVHSGDVKIYENLDRLPRAYLAYQVTGVTDPEQALTFLRTHYTVSPIQASAAPPVVVEGLAGFSSQPTPGDQAELVAYAPERVEIRTRTAQPTLLVLSDSFFPGWHATIDGASAPIHPTNYLFRGVSLPAGEHTVIFHYQPTQWPLGVGVTLTFVVVSLLVLLVDWAQKIRQMPN